MSTITIPRKVGFEDIEQIIAELDGCTEPCNLELPRSFEYRGFGIQISLIQIIFKWMRTANPGSLVIPIAQNDPAELKQFAESFFGYIVLLTVWKNIEIVNTAGDPLKLSFRPFTSDMAKKIEFFEELPNNKIFIPCFDHYSKTKGLSHWFYPDHDKFANVPSALDNTIYRALQSLGKIYKGRFNAAVSPVEDDIEKILWELLKNTDEHAKTDYLNLITLSPNTRGMSMEILRSNRRNFSEHADQHLGLVEYYEKSADEQDSFFLEISVYDSGPGLVKRFLGKHWHDSIDINNEVTVIKQCLQKGSTSVETWKGKNKGFGLNAVLELLTKLNGFLKIRTNRCSLYRDLIKHPHSDVEDAREIPLFDWNTNSESVFTEMSNVEGVILTMAFPLPKNNYE